MTTALITADAAHYLFNNYNNIDDTAADNFVDYVFGLGDRTITGNLDVTGTITAETSVLTNLINQRTTAGLVLSGDNAKKMSFWGASPAAQQVFATGASHTVDQLITFLQSVGLCRQS